MTIPPPCCTLDIFGAEQERLVAMFKALGNPIRFEIMKFLVTRPGCIKGCAEARYLRQPAPFDTRSMLFRTTQAVS